MLQVIFLQVVHDVVHGDTADEQRQSEDKRVLEHRGVRIERSLSVHEENGDLNESNQAVGKVHPVRDGLTSSPLDVDSRNGSLHMSMPVV